jgi:hypothetical protein
MPAARPAIVIAGAALADAAVAPPSLLRAPVGA